MRANRLPLEIAGLLCLKLAALTLLYFAFFSAQPHIDSTATSARLLGSER